LAQAPKYGCQIGYKMSKFPPGVPAKFRIVKPGMGCERFTALRGIEDAPQKGITWAKWSTGFATVSTVGKSSVLIMTGELDANEYTLISDLWNTKAVIELYSNSETGEPVGFLASIPARNTNKKGA
jgi:hypothetical protein